MMGRRRRSAGFHRALVLPVLLVAAAAGAQPTPSADPRARYQRDQQQDRPKTQQQFDESLRKFEAEDLPTRLEGIAAMGQIDKKDEPRALAYLLSAANDPNTAVRSKAIDTLGHMRAREATTPLVQRLFMRDTDDFTRRRILASLAMIGDKRAVGPLLDFAGGKANPETRASAIYALGEIGDPKSLPALERMASDADDSMLRDVAKVAVRRIKAKPLPTETPPSLVDERRPPPPPSGEEEE
jgi:HEAT repeat protein